MPSEPPEGNQLTPPSADHDAANRGGPGGRCFGVQQSPAGSPLPHVRLAGPHPSMWERTWSRALSMPGWLRAHSFFPSWLPSRWRHPGTGYLAAVLVQALAVLLTAWLLAVAPPISFPGTFTLLAVVVVALTFGAGPSLAASLLGGGLLLLLVLPPPWGRLVDNLVAVLGVGILTMVGIIMSVLVSRIEHSRRAAVAAAEARDTFLAMAAHELRTPLTAYMGLVQLAQWRSRRLADAARQRDLDHAADAAALADLLAQADTAVARQNRFVNDLLDVARIQTGKLTLQIARCDLGEVVRVAVEEQRAQQPGRDVRLELPATPVQILADGERIGQVVSNYLSNAFKYSVEREPITVVLAVSADSAQVSVRDRGPGLRPEEGARVWDLYHRVSDTAVLSGSGVGLGLGVYLCRSIVLAHPGGQVGVESVVGEGATFWFRLPVADDPLVDLPAT